ncbi:MAG: tryptophan 7-halogenase, partial [Planctomycetales bacterium]|nr:tryptophan 7-halogenase [Planctomycetales bacterium]
LFTDSAILGTWERRINEPINAYTTIDTMNAGWAWQTDHEDRVNRGYTYCSDFITREQAEEEFVERNPGIQIMGHVGFTPGVYEKSWEKNVVAMGNATGFVEPLEATALWALCDDCKSLMESIRLANGTVSPSLRAVYNRRSAGQWEGIRYNLGAHFKYNRRLSTPFWRRCQEEIDLGWAQQIEDFYRENGPSLLFREDWVSPPVFFDVADYLYMLVGQDVPYKTTWQISSRESQLWDKRKAHFRQRARAAMTAEEAIKILRHPDYPWEQEFAPLQNSSPY